MIKATVNFHFEIPKFDLTHELENIAEKIFIPEIAGHIQDSTDIEGKPYEPLAEFTIKDKGHNKPLIGKERRLYNVSGYYTKRRGKNAVVIYVKHPRTDVARILQVEGVRSKKYGLRFFHFFGVNPQMELKAVNYLRNKIEVLTRAK